MCYPELLQALQQQQYANTGIPPSGQEPQSPMQIFQSYLTQAPTQGQQQTYNYRAGPSEADILGALNAGRAGAPAPAMPTVIRSRTPGAASGSSVIGAGSTEKKHSFGSDSTTIPAPAAAAAAAPASKATDWFVDTQGKYAGRGAYGRLDDQGKWEFYDFAAGEKGD